MIHNTLTKLILEDRKTIWEEGNRRISLNLIGVKFKGYGSNPLILPYLCIILLIFLSIGEILISI